MTVTLTPEQEAMVRERVESGRFGDPAAVVEEALRLLEEREQERLAHLRALLDEGAAQLDRGEGIPVTPELWERIWRNALEKAASGAKLRDDVIP